MPVLRRLAAIAVVSAQPWIAHASGALEGQVLDPAGGAIEGALVALLTPQLQPVRSVESKGDGGFRFAPVAAGSYELRVSHPLFEPARRAVRIVAGRPVREEVRLALAGLAAEVTVFADPGRAADAAHAPQPVNVISQEQLEERGRTVLAEAVAGEPGVALQRTSSSVAGIFVRGLTGRNVNVFLDGVPYSTTAQRGGINTFLDLVEPETLGGMEVLRGPQGAQYGSASLGGSVHLLSRSSAFAAHGEEWRGRLALGGSTHDEGLFAAQGAEWAGETLALSLGLAERRAGRFRPGGGRDPLAAAERFLGLPSRVVDGARLDHTGFAQYGGHLRLEWLAGEGTHLSFSYRRAQQQGGERYDQLLGGDGNLVADLDDLMLDFAVARLETSRVPGLSSFTVTTSYNAQREERVNQGGGGNPRGRITRQFDRTNVAGIQLRAGRELGPGEELEVGVELFEEDVAAHSSSFSPVERSTRVERPRIPDGASYGSWGAWLQAAAEPRAGRVALSAALRWSGAAYRVRALHSPPGARPGGEPLWPDDALAARDLTWRLGGRFEAAPWLRLLASVSRGFRVPNATDLGTLGVTGAGFEVAAADVTALGGEVGTTAGADAVSTGLPVENVAPERSLSIEGRVELHTGRLRLVLGGFRNDLDRVLEKQALILAPGAVGARLGGEEVVAQLDSGVVFVGASPAPVLVRTSFSQVRMRGLEQSAALDLGRGLGVEQSFTWIHAEDRRSGRPPNLEGGVPGPNGSLRLSYTPPAGRFWAALELSATARQTRLSSLDLEDRRVGASRSRQSIERFFDNGAAARGLVGPGADGLSGTDDDVLLATGETLAELLDRVLGPGVDAAPLRRSVPGYATLDLKLGVRLGARHRVLLDLINLTDASYRGMSWGLPGPGRGVRVRYSTAF